MHHHNDDDFAPRTPQAFQIERVVSIGKWLAGVIAAIVGATSAVLLYMHKIDSHLERMDDSLGRAWLIEDEVDSTNEMSRKNKTLDLPDPKLIHRNNRHGR